ncbi:MAG: hypothetical protein IJV88_06050 [Ruminococcus sp.]|nr:hypothetical protein [Ruminococcus sp.]
MKKRILAFLLAAFILIAFSGCQGVTFNVTELMSPPKATGEKALIQNLIEEEAGPGYTLKYPQNGNYRSAITTMDIDADETEEAIAFYLPAGETQTVHLLIMDIVDKEWTVIGNHISLSSTVDRLEFADMDGDGTKEVVVGWSTYNTLINDLCVYLVEDGSTREIISKTKYSNLLCDDFTNNGKDELLLISLYTTDNPASASLISLNDTKNSVYPLGQTEIDADTVSFSQLLTGNIAKNQYGAVLDGVTSTGSFNTQILYYDKQLSQLCRIHFTEDKPTNQAVRNYNVLSTDIDDDGIIEVPNTFKMNIEETQTESVPAALIYWCEYGTDGSVSIDDTTACSLIYGFYFSIPDSWGKDYTAYINYSTNEIIFYEWTEKNTPGETLLILKMFPHEKWNEGTSSAGYTELTQNDSYVYAFITPESNSEKIMSNDEVISAFSLI